jgi:hypothetical protein
MANIIFRAPKRSKECLSYAVSQVIYIGNVIFNAECSDLPPAGASDKTQVCIRNERSIKCTSTCHTKDFLKQHFGSVVSCWNGFYAFTAQRFNGNTLCLSCLAVSVFLSCATSAFAEPIMQP